jgi:hypothetical protein
VDDTTDNDPPPFIIENYGTVAANITNATANSNLWVRAPSPSDKFQLKVNDSEPGSINMSGSATEWTNFSTSNVTIIRLLNYSTIHNTARVDIRMQVPTDEPSGVKTVDVTFYGVQG